MTRPRFWWNLLVLLSVLGLALSLLYGYLEARLDRQGRERWHQYANEHCIDISYRSDAMWMCGDGAVYRRRY